VVELSGPPYRESIELGEIKNYEEWYSSLQIGLKVSSEMKFIRIPVRIEIEAPDLEAIKELLVEGKLRE